MIWDDLRKAMNMNRDANGNYHAGPDHQSWQWERTTPHPYSHDCNQNTSSHVRFRGLRLELETLVTDLEYEEV